MSTPVHLQSPPHGTTSPRSYALTHQRPQSSFKGSARIGDFDIIGKLGEGTFGEVHRATTKKKPGEIFALKKILMHNEKDGFPITALREIKLLKLLRHQNIVRLDEVAVEHDKKQKDGKKRSIMYMVMPYMDHDLCGLLENPSVHLTESSIKCYMLQLLEGVRYLHDKSILHRDMKAANLLINNKGILQIADFGLARHYDEPVPVAGRGGGQATRDYTTLVVTRWYRPPELLLSLRRYTTAIDLWGVGCVFGEMLLGKPILPGESDALQLKIIFDLCGNPTDDNMPGWDQLPGAAGMKFGPKPGNLQQRFREHGSGAISLLNELLKLDWKTRINAIDALNHPYFRHDPKPSKPEDIPQFEESHELDRKKFRDQRNAIPAAPKGGTVGMGPDNGYDQNSNQGYQNGDNYRGHHNGGERRPPHHHSNGIPPPPPRDDIRKPAWARRDDRPQNESRDPRHTLPPRPVTSVDRDFAYEGQRSERDRDRDPRRPPPRAGVGPNIDTYIPNYNSGERPPPRSRDGRPPPRERERDPRDPRDDYRRRDDRDRDRALEYDERPRTTRTRSRSRSPVRERDHRERSRDWDRERDDRGRDGYRRRS